MAARSHFRSISLPSRSHPSTLKIEEQLGRIKALEHSSLSTSKSICDGLMELEDLYTSMDELLNMNSTRQILSSHQNRRWVDELIDEFMKLLDICGKTRDLMTQIHEQAQALRSALRRRKGDSSVRRSISNYTHLRKKVKKEALKLISATKQMGEKIGSSRLLNQDLHLYAVIRALKEICSVNISIFQSLLLFIAIQFPKSKPSRWSLVSKLMHKGAVGCQEPQTFANEFEDMDAALSDLGDGDDGDKLQVARGNLETLDFAIEGFENGLDSTFRQMIRSRACLLNAITE